MTQVTLYSTVTPKMRNGAFLLALRYLIVTKTAYSYFIAVVLSTRLGMISGQSSSLAHMPRCAFCLVRRRKLLRGPLWEAEFQ